MKRISIFLFLFSITSSLVIGQDKVNYTIINNHAQISKLKLSLYPIDVRMMKGLNMGFGAQLSMRPTTRLGVVADAYNMLYFNPYRFNDNGNNTNGFKRMGGISANVIGEFIWRRKGAVIIGDKTTEKFYLSKEVETSGLVTTQTVKYIPFQFNTLIERTLRGGVIYDNFPIDNNTLSAISFAFGLGKKKAKGAILGFNNGNFLQSSWIGYSFDILVGFPNYLDAVAAGGSNIGLRLVLERHQVFTKKKDLRGFSMDYQVEFAIKPGGIGFMSVRLGLPVFKSGIISTEGVEYKEQKAPKKKLAKFFRFI